MTTLEQHLTVLKQVPVETDAIEINLAICVNCDILMEFGMDLSDDAEADSPIVFSQMWVCPTCGSLEYVSVP